LYFATKVSGGFDRSGQLDGFFEEGWNGCRLPAEEVRLPKKVLFAPKNAIIGP
jgi:hypothetical protein